MPAHLCSVLHASRIVLGGLICVFCLAVGSESSTIATDDSYIAGYASAVLQHEFNVPGAILQARDGVVVVTADSLGKVDRQKVLTALEKIPGVVRVEVREEAESLTVPAEPPQAVIREKVPKAESKFLPRDLLVAPFHADPRWPHFSVASRQVSFGQEPGNMGSANFGETFALYRNAAPMDGQWELRPITRSRQCRLYCRIAHELPEGTILRLPPSSPPEFTSGRASKRWILNYPMS
jgi:hypothetical protein